MPSKTPRQARAMQAAAHGRSKLGIPKKVGEEFVEADRGGKARGRKAKGSSLGGKPGKGKR